MQLTELHIQRFEQEGYLVLENALKDFDLDPVIREYEEYIDTLASQWFAEGKIGSLHDDAPFKTRLVRLCEQNLELAAGANDLFDLYRFRGKRTFEFLRNDNLLDLVESLVGPEVICSPIQHLRAKLPTAMPPAPLMAVTTALLIEPERTISTMSTVSLSVTRRPSINELLIFNRSSMAPI